MADWNGAFFSFFEKSNRAVFYFSRWPGFTFSFLFFQICDIESLAKISPKN
jgi:hypothetical protein